MIALLYLALASPVFTAATIRFALTRKARSFLNLRASLALLFSHISGYARFLVLEAVVLGMTVVAAVIAVSTGIGAPLVIPVGAAGIWTITYFLGQLAAKCVADV